MTAPRMSTFIALLITTSVYLPRQSEAQVTLKTGTVEAEIIDGKIPPERLLDQADGDLDALIPGKWYGFVNPRVNGAVVRVDVSAMGFPVKPKFFISVEQPMPSAWEINRRHLDLHMDEAGGRITATIHSANKDSFVIVVNAARRHEGPSPYYEHKDWIMKLLRHVQINWLAVSEN